MSTSRGRPRVGARLWAVVGGLLVMAVASPALGAAGGGAPNLVSDPSFEFPDVGSTYVTLPDGTVFGGWTTTGSVDLVGTYWDAAEGDQSMDLSGAGAGSIYQDLHTQPGIRYRLAFAMAGNHACAPRVKHMTVSWGGIVLGTLAFDTTGLHDPNMGWHARQFRIIATASLTRLEFASLDDTDCGPTLDAVLVEPVG